MTQHDPETAEASLAEALRSEGVQFALAERAARFGYWRLRLADNHVTWSPGMYRLLGVDPSERADNNWLLAQIQDEDARMILEKIGHAIKTRSPFQYRSRSKDPNVAAPIVDTHGEVEIGPDGRVVSVIGVCHDVTRQVIAEAERENAQRAYRTIAEEASDIILLHENGRIVFASNALDRILKRNPEELEDGRYLELVHPADVAEATKVRGRPLPGEIRSATYRNRHADGHYVWIETRTRAIYDDATGEFLCEISVGRDVTERREQELKMRAAQERAEAASRAKSLFLANMSHELRTPLNAIMGFADLMRTEAFGALGHDRYREYAATICNSGQHLLELITDILDTAKIESGKLELHPEHIDLGNAIRECTDLLDMRAREAGLDMKVKLGSQASSLTADRRAVKQILLNLLSNAIKFTPAGGRISVETSSRAGHLALAVRDDGLGIPADQIPRLGRPFEQVCVDPLLAKGGSGLGLALVQALAQKHGGTMRIESEEGVGTTVTVEFPVSQHVLRVAS
ncbi:MAG: ATP-binding protein [Rhizomicrobium sp.]|jgi:PAS domain S-box-containing protein